MKGLSIHTILKRRNIKQFAVILFVFGILFTPFKGFSQTNYPAIQGSLENNEPFPILISTKNLETSPYCIFTILSDIGFSRLFIFAPNGEPLFHKRIEALSYDFKLLPNGFMSYFDKSLGGFVILDSVFTEVDILKMQNGYTTDFHELVVAPDGDYILFGINRREVDMSILVAGGYAKAQVSDMIIQKIDAEKNVVFEWNSKDHYNILDTYVDVLSHVIDYVHFNSIEFDSDSTIIVSSRNMCELTKINLNTGGTIWRFGGNNNQFTLKNFDRLPSAQHTLRKKNDSTYTVFDNGYFSDVKFSMALELTLDEDLMIAEKKNDYRHEPEIFAPILGNIQNLDNGHTLIFWGINEGYEIGGLFTEYNKHHEIVYEGKFINCESPTYRVQKFKWENKTFGSSEEIIIFPATQPRDSVTKSFIITNYLNETLVLNEFVTRTSDFRINRDSIVIPPKGQGIINVVFNPLSNGAFADILSLRSNRINQGIATQIAVQGTAYEYTGNVRVILEQDVQFFPNPFINEIHYSSDAEIERIEITNLNGTQVWSGNIIQNAGAIGTNEISEGVYIISSFLKDGSEIHKKFIKTHR